MDISDLIHAGTRYCALFGHPVKHSASPAMQNAGFLALGLPWRYIAFDVAPEKLAAAMAGAKAMGFIGLNLTIPHKVAGMSLVDVLDESAEKFGAVNTVRFEAMDADRVWRSLGMFEETPSSEVRAVGFNTDAAAISMVLREDLGINLRGAAVLLLGAGGAGRTAALQLASEGIRELWLVNRTSAKAEALAAEVNRRWPDLLVQIGYPRHPVELVVNATSVGMRPGDPLPIDTGAFKITQTAAVFDMIYRPAETPLLQAAKAAGCRCVNGLGMLLYQGAAALELWTGRKAPLEQMRHALETEVYGK